MADERKPVDVKGLAFSNMWTQESKAQGSQERVRKVMMQVGG